MMIRNVIVILFIFVTMTTSLLSSAAAAAPATEKEAPKEKTKKASWVAHILRQRSESGIQNLSFETERVPVVLVAKNESLRPLVQLKGTYLRDGWQIFAQENKPLTMAEDKKTFTIFAYLNSQVNEVALTAKGPDGAIEREVIYLFAPEAQEFQIVSGWDSIMVSLGIANFSYSQTNFGTFTSTTGVVGVTYLSPEKSSRWGYYGNGDITVLTLDSSPISANPQVISARGDFTYRLPIYETSQWRTRAAAGLYYITMQSNGSPFGFENLFAPDIGVRSQYFKNQRESYVIDFHYVPMESGIFGKQRAFQLGGYWNRTSASLKQWQLGLNYSSSHFESSDQNIEVDMLTLSLGYSI